jgi:general secretion pathway protein C
MVYAVGDTLTDGVTLAAIAADHVVLDRGGTREALWLDTGGADAVQRFDPAAAAGAQQPAPFGSAAPAPQAMADPGADPAPPSGVDVPVAPPAQGARPADTGDGQ